MKRAFFTSLPLQGGTDHHLEQAMLPTSLPLSPRSCKWWGVAAALLVCNYLSRWDRLQGMEKIHYLTHFSQFPTVFKANNDVSIWRSSTTPSKLHAPIPQHILMGGVAGKNMSHPKIKPSRFPEAVCYKVTSITTQPLSVQIKKTPGSKSCSFKTVLSQHAMIMCLFYVQVHMLFKIAKYLGKNHLIKSC